MERERVKLMAMVAFFNPYLKVNTFRTRTICELGFYARFRGTFEGMCFHYGEKGPALDCQLQEMDWLTSFRHSVSMDR